jgi:hypothetical protein
MSAEIIPLMPDEDLLNPLARPYQDQGFDGDDETGQWLLLQASRMDGAIQQGWKMRLAQGEILTQVRHRVPGFFDHWLQAHWPQMSRKAVGRLMATWEQREVLSPFMDDDANSSHVTNQLPTAAVYSLAEGGGMEEVVVEVLRRLKAGEHVGVKDVADLNREAKARRSGKPVPRPPQPAKALALRIFRKGKVEHHRAALALLEQFQEVDAQAVMDEIHLRQLPKGNVIYGVTAEFHRSKDGLWIRLPNAGQIDVIPQELEVIESEPAADNGAKVLSLEQAAAALGLAVTSLRTRISPKQLSAKGPLVRNGWRASKAGRGQIRLEQVNE